MSEINNDFFQRVSHIPFHGIGLSVDVYTPDVFDLTDQLTQHGLSYGYLEVFKAGQSAIDEVRFRRPTVLLEYHADGLWVTQPDWTDVYPYEQELRTAVAHLSSMSCFWINQECATKQIGGHSFGTYLPPLLLESSACMTASNVELVQRYLDEYFGENTSHAPLFLLETPPLTYFVLGNIGYAEFFRMIADRCACGFVLDIGHIWTVYRYTGAWEKQTLEQFLEKFLNKFPMERVVQIHIAGLDCHHAVPYEVRGHACLPNWIDAHHAPIPSGLFEMLEHVLSHPQMSNVKGLAMEVDTKGIELIVQEYAWLRGQFETWEQQERRKQQSVFESRPQIEPFAHRTDSPACGTDKYLVHQYEDYVRLMTCLEKDDVVVLDIDNIYDIRELNSYRRYYLPHEISEWGGQLQDMFPRTFRTLEGSGLEMKGFLDYWYGHPQRVCEPYDFFLLKIHYFVEYIQAIYPSGADQVSQEAIELRNSYVLSCQLN
ncbi:MAG: hypothetical protein NPIRA04_32430 [Nitrospirales bacterium]|nr:MAG: hypothetical protein NPIRA04_32430 [Nitrospirales bacterium]